MTNPSITTPFYAIQIGHRLCIPQSSKESRGDYHGSCYSYFTFREWDRDPVGLGKRPEIVVGVWEIEREPVFPKERRNSRNVVEEETDTVRQRSKKYMQEEDNPERSLQSEVSPEGTLRYLVTSRD